MANPIRKTRTIEDADKMLWIAAQMRMVASRTTEKINGWYVVTFEVPEKSDRWQMLRHGLKQAFPKNRKAQNNSVN